MNALCLRDRNYCSYPSGVLGNLRVDARSLYVSKLTINLYFSKLTINLFRDTLIGTRAFRKVKFFFFDSNIVNKIY